MSRSKPPRQRKRYALVNPIAMAIGGACVTDPRELDKLLLRELASLDALTRGQGTRSQWDDLATVANLCEVAIGMGIGPEAAQDCKAAQDGLLEAAQRYKATGRMLLTGPAIKALTELIAWHDLQRRSVSRSTYEAVIKKTVARIQSGHPSLVKA